MLPRIQPMILDPSSSSNHNAHITNLTSFWSSLQQQAPFFNAQTNPLSFLSQILISGAGNHERVCSATNLISSF
ncbi:hypothetical protein Ahy_A05g021704 isoform A [Arachis hypogaea]|uniref:Uncharacterized protein n=1 Tax=Arachis hypogaea TaxID=3818 RepID=A0A445CY29_ARAHY|nr:hypothetical protein Ahy_A05g021704 isoform A [Arachis hypogaea]